MKYKKPLTITCVFAVLALIVLGIGLLTSPKPDALPEPPENQVPAGENSEQNMDADQMKLENLAEQMKALAELTDQKTEELEHLMEQKKVLEELIAEKEKERESLTEQQKDSEDLHRIDEELESLIKEKNALEDHIAQNKTELESLAEEKKALEDLTDQEGKDSDNLQMLNSGLYAMGMEEEGLTATGGTIQIYNHSDAEITFGDDYSLWRLEQEQWVPVPYILENWAFNLPAYPVGSGKMRTQELDWEWLYGKLESGTYLLKKPVLVPGEAEGYDKIELGIQFTL